MGELSGSLLSNQLSIGTWKYVPYIGQSTTYASSIQPIPLGIKRVIFNDPATIVLWNDGSKTVVKVHDEPFDREKGMAMAIAKKILGDKFHATFRECCGED